MKIEALRGYRYAGGDTRDLSRVVAPPYDQISPADQDRLYAMSPHNIVRVTYRKDEPGVDKYGRAHQVLQSWLAARIWVRDEEPAIYPYQQTYRVNGQSVTRRGFVALGEVSDYACRVVLPHERTHAGPKLDRLQLLEATAADVGLLFMLVSDPTGEVMQLTEPRGEPIGEARDLRGEWHRLWRLTDPRVVTGVRALMAGRPVIIADGHHRYETAVEYARRHPTASTKLMAFFALEASGLTILANHRLVRGRSALSLSELTAAAAPWFEVSALTDPLAFRPAPRSIGVITPDGAAVLTMRRDSFDRIAWPAGTSRTWRSLPVAILHEGLLKPFLHIDDAGEGTAGHLDYTADPAEAVRQARQGLCQAAFLIAPTTPAELQTIVQGGEVLPQKSTHFYPKLLDGLIFHRLGEGLEHD